MKKLLLVTTAAMAGLAVVAAPAEAKTLYGAARYGVSDADIDTGFGSLSTDQGSTFGAEIGVASSNGLRVGVSVDRATADIALSPGFSFEGQTTTFAVGAQYDVLSFGDAKAFVGIGYDYTKAEVNAGFASLEGDGDGWHYDVGVSHQVTPTLSVEVMRRAHKGDLAFDFFPSDVSLDQSAWTFGLRATF